MSISYPKFITGKNSSKGLAGYLQRHAGPLGQAVVPSGATSVDVAHKSIQSTDLVFLTLVTAGANPCVVSSVVITPGTGFTVNVSTDPGSGGAVFNFEIKTPYNL